MASRHVADRVSHGQHRQPEGQRHPDKTDPKVRKARSQNSRTASPENEPKRPDEFRRKLLGHCRPPKGPVK
jgi:hypothetical protein